MTDKTDLNEQVKLHVGFMKAADNPVSDHYHLKEIKRLFIDQACDAVEVRKNKLLEINESMPAKEQAMLVAGLCEAEQAIREKFSE